MPNPTGDLTRIWDHIFHFNIVDTLTVPRDLETGEYTLSFRCAGITLKREAEREREREREKESRGTQLRVLVVWMHAGGIVNRCACTQ